MLLRLKYKDERITESFTKKIYLSFIYELHHWIICKSHRYKTENEQMMIFWTKQQYITSFRWAQAKTSRDAGKWNMNLNQHWPNDYFYFWYLKYVIISRANYKLISSVYFKYVLNINKYHFCGRLITKDVILTDVFLSVYLIPPLCLSPPRLRLWWRLRWRILAVVFPGLLSPKLWTP